MSYIKSNMTTPEEIAKRTCQEPKKIPETISEFNLLSLAERRWLFDNKHAVYEKFQKQNRKEW